MRLVIQETLQKHTLTKNPIAKLSEVFHKRYDWLRFFVNFFSCLFPFVSNLLSVCLPFSAQQHDPSEIEYSYSSVSRQYYSHSLEQKDIWMYWPGLATLVGWYSLSKYSLWKRHFFYFFPPQLIFGTLFFTVLSFFEARRISFFSECDIWWLFFCFLSVCIFLWLFYLLTQNSHSCPPRIPLQILLRHLNKY